MAKLKLHSKRRRLLRPVFSVVIQPRGADISMPEPVLDFGNVRLIIEGIGGRGGSQGVKAEVVHGDPGFCGVVVDHL